MINSPLFSLIYPDLNLTNEYIFLFLIDRNHVQAIDQLDGVIERLKRSILQQVPTPGELDNYVQKIFERTKLNNELVEMRADK